ncbi:acyl-CoA dehydrogenase family protein [Streptomyces sp. NPDC051677]|uniref:acyl-CoA dehydrogenase family protein n=1 Tax=Streptomyces sp. NPDC051677 TaxID=3365669 RepID=UPI0037D2DDDD
MPFALTGEQRELASTARQVLAERAGPLPPAWDAAGEGLHRDLWRSLAELGFLGLGVPEERGGSGGGLRELCLVAEQVGGALPRIPFIATVTVLAAVADDVRAIANGDVVAVPAWETFPIVPGRRDALRLSASTVDGVMRAVPYGMDADLLLAFAGTAPVLVDLAQAGVRRQPVEAFDVTEPAAEIELSGVAARVLAPVTSWATLHTVLAAELIGTGQRALDGAVAYAGQRRQFGRAIGSFQAIKHLLADLHVQLDASRLLVEWAAAAIDDGHADAETAARTALAAASDAAQAAAGEALQVHGGIGFTWEHPSHVFLKRARARRSLLGSPAHQLDVLADHILVAQP